MSIYIIVTQHFYVSDSIHYQCADDTPILGAYKSLEDAKRACERFVKAVQDVTNYEFKTIEPTPCIVAKYGLFDGDICMISYNIVREILL